MSCVPVSRSSGMSLLELLVAMAIMAMALGMLYRAMVGGARAAGDATRYQEAIAIAESLLYANADLPEGGWNEQGQSGVFHWAVHTQPYTTPVQHSTPGAVPLYALNVTVSWEDQGRRQSLGLGTLVPQRPPVLTEGGARR